MPEQRLWTDLVVELDLEDCEKPLKIVIESQGKLYRSSMSKGHKDQFSWFSVHRRSTSSSPSTNFGKTTDDYWQRLLRIIVYDRISVKKAIGGAPNAKKTHAFITAAEMMLTKMLSFSRSLVHRFPRRALACSRLPLSSLPTQKSLIFCVPKNRQWRRDVVSLKNEGTFGTGDN